MAEIIKEKRFEINVELVHEFHYIDDPSIGFMFSVNERAELRDPTPFSQQNYEACLNGDLAVVDLGIHEHHTNYVHPAELKCDCGRIVILSSFTNSCKCGADYNMSGQLLGLREFWGEETGEHWTECI